MTSVKDALMEKGSIMSILSQDLKLTDAEFVTRQSLPSGQVSIGLCVSGYVMGTANVYHFITCMRGAVGKVAGGQRGEAEVVSCHCAFTRLT